MSTVHPVTANRVGPTNAGPIEEAFLQAVRQRFGKLKALLQETIAENDALRIQDFNARTARDLIGNADEREAFDFPTKQGVTRAFLRWLIQAIRDEILEPLNPAAIENGEHWTAQFVENALTAGVNQSTGILFQQNISIKNIPNEDIPQRPIFAKTLQDLHQRTYGNLKGITDDIAPVVREEVTTGFSQGFGPNKIADRVVKEVETIQRSRAETLARTETIHAHAQGSIRNFERAGVNVVNHAFWDAADDGRTCPFCERLDGVALTLDEVKSGAVRWAINENRQAQIWRLAPPAHPNCRCNLTPAIGADIPTRTLQDRLKDQFDGVTVLSGA